MENSRFYNKDRHGFRSIRSCLSQLHDHFDRLLGGTEVKTNRDVVDTDFAKAFNKYYYFIIAYKLKDFGFTGKVVCWIYSFLNRLQRVNKPIRNCPIPAYVSFYI